MSLNRIKEFLMDDCRLRLISGINQQSAISNQQSTIDNLFGRRRLRPRLHTRAVVGLEIAERVLHAGEQVLEQRLDRVVPLGVAVRL